MAIAHQASPSEAPSKAEETVAKLHPWISPLARIGYAAKGFVYALIGILTLLSLDDIHIGQQGGQMNQRGMLNFLARQPFGALVLWTICVGLAGYSVSRLLAAIFDPEGKGIWKRLGYLFSAGAYSYIAYVSAKTAIGFRANEDDKSFARTMVIAPYGHLLLAIAGVVMLAIAVVQCINAVKAGFLRIFKLKEMPRWLRLLAVWTGRIGLSARAVLFGLIGGFLIYAGLAHDPQAAGGIGQALQTLRRTVGGDWVLAAVCVGLIFYGVFMFLQARFRHVYIADPDVVEEVNGDRP